VVVAALLALWRCRRVDARAVAARPVEHKASELTEMVRCQRGTPGRDDGKSDSSDSFYSCNEMDLENPSACARQPRRPMLQKRPRQNRNAITDFRWLQDLLEHITEGRASALPCEDAETGERRAPLFAVAGTSPSKVPPSPMQAMLYAARPDASVDFWFVKPEAKHRGSLDRETLRRHPKGKKRNVPLRSKDLFTPLAARFSGETEGCFTYGVDLASGRAVVEERLSNGRRRRLLVYFVWIESWRGGRRPFLEGKVCYQRQDVAAEPRPSADAAMFYARQYRIQDGVMHLAGHQDEELLPSLMPSDGFQELV